MSESAKALLDKLEVILARPTLWTAVGYLHPLNENEIDAEVAALHDEIYPPPAEPEPATSEEPAPEQSEQPVSS